MGRYLVCPHVLTRPPLATQDSHLQGSQCSPARSPMTTQHQLPHTLGSNKRKQEGWKEIALWAVWGLRHRKCTARHTVLKGIVPMQALRAYVPLSFLDKQGSAGLTWSHICKILGWMVMACICEAELYGAASPTFSTPFGYPLDNLWPKEFP